MSVRYRVMRALRYTTIALLMAASFEVLEHLIVLHLATWPSHIASIFACAAAVFLLSSMSFSREQRQPQQLSRSTQQLHDITGGAQDATAESEARYRSLFENMLEGFAYCEMLFDGG